jgi:phosphate:Na+ symporter
MTGSAGALLSAAGGLGLFLLGMGLMTEALRSLGGNRLRQALLRFTRSPWSGASAGAIGTALVQSSTATTVATVGFVSAGLLSFQASLGIILGVNVGSTGLGWLVALLGIKFDLAGLMLPLVLLGSGLRLLGRGRQALLGQALAGFAWLFVGIGALQQALAGHGLLLDPGRFDAASSGGRLPLLLLGLLSTVITQSSGAGVATTLAAMAAGAIGLPQACALVIGMDLGTTVTALMASLGASVSARRTAAAHVTFNLFTAVAAFLLLPAYLALLQGLWPALEAAGSRIRPHSLPQRFQPVGGVAGAALYGALRRADPAAGAAGGGAPNRRSAGYPFRRSRHRPPPCLSVGGAMFAGTAPAAERWAAQRQQPCWPGCAASGDVAGRSRPT